MYRIIGGKCKGRKVLAPKNFNLRPTTDFAKEALFNILMHKLDLQNTTALDLYSGIGSITLELASRNAKQITSVENNYKHARFTEQKAEELELSSQINVIKSDVQKFLERANQKFDFIFSDAPFDFELDVYEKNINTIFKNELLASEGLLIIEHSSKKDLSFIDRFVEIRKYGSISFSFFE